LGAAARAAAAEVAAAEAALVKQQALTEMLSAPRAVPVAAGEACRAAPRIVQTLEEQEAFCEWMARPREKPDTPPWPRTPGRAQTPTRTASEQQRRCNELAQARQRDQDDEDHPALAGRWRDLLNARKAEPANEVVEQARLQLAEMQRRAAERSRPNSAAQSQRTTPKRRAAAPGAEEAPNLDELRAVAEELLWVVLLQWRSCPKSQTAKDRAVGGNNSEVPKDELEERLGSLLLAAVGPALRPVVRKVIGPGTRLARQARSEFPRLAVHLGFRESEDKNPAPSTWTAAEVAAHAETVRACRDQVLKSELTKTLSALAV